MVDFINDPPLEQKKEKVRIKLKREERDYYSKLFDAAKPKGSNKLSGNDAVLFFRKSKLPSEMLKKIWILAAQTNPAFVDRDEFYVALRLVALAQSRQEVCLKSITNNIDAPLPKFESFQLPSVAPPEVMMPPPMMMPPGGMAPPSMMMPPIGMMPNSTILSQIVTPPIISIGELKKYDRIFDSMDSSRIGKITADEMTELMKRTKLSQELLERAWELGEMSDDGYFGKANVMIILHLLVKCKAGAELPSVVPAELKKTVNAFLRGEDIAEKPQPMMMPIRPTIPSKPVDENDPFAEIAPTQSFGGAAPLYGFPQLMAPMYSNPVDERKISPSYEEAPTMMNVNPVIEKSYAREDPPTVNTEILRKYLAELQSLGIEKRRIKDSIFFHKESLRKEEELLNRQVIALRDIAIEYASFAKELSNPMRPQVAYDGSNSGSDKSSKRTGTTSLGKTSEFIWGSDSISPNGKGGHDRYPQVEEEGFDFS